MNPAQVAAMPASPQRLKTNAEAQHSTRQARASTLPSQDSAPAKRHSKHRHHASHSHHKSHIHSPESTGATSLNLSPLSPLGELLSPVRNVAEGLGRDLSELAAQARGGLDRTTERERKEQERRSWVSRGGSSTEEKERPSGSQKASATMEDVRRVRRKRVAAEEMLRERYNALASSTLERRRAIEASRNRMLDTVPQIESTLSSLRSLLADTSGMLSTLTSETIPSATAEAQSQVDELQQTLKQMETERIASLQSRVTDARTKVSGLGERMNVVQKRVHGWEEKEREADRRRRRRVGIVWGTLGTLVIVMVVVAVVGRISEDVTKKQGLGGNWTEEVMKGVSDRNWTAKGRVEHILRDVGEGNKVGGDLKEGPVTAEVVQGPTKELLREDDWLERIFDEL